MAKQPFYHAIDDVLFTATRPIPEKEVCDAIIKAIKTLPGVIKDSVEVVGWSDAEPGDPSDL